MAGVALLTSCGRLQAKQHPFPEAVGQSSASPGTSAGPSAGATPRGSALPIPTGSLPPDRLAELPPDELFKRAKAATQRVKTVRTGAELSGRDMSISFDIRIDLQYRDFVGSMTMDGGRMEIR
ncbi:MAG: hypothetical protein HOU01_16415, partial [Streptomycetaceae bacterium]|nr:hypothetical protein [Streptomycetaceae bacterium]